VTVERILNTKGTHASVVAPDTKISGLIEALALEEVGALVVSADGTTIDGIISERDIVRGLQEYGPSVLDHPVRDLMTKDVVTCTADDPVAGVMAIMDARSIRHVPVVDEGLLAGIITIRDIVKLRLDEVQSETNAMRDYISYGR
jgi:CBS domain-containing protein